MRPERVPETGKVNDLKNGNSKNGKLRNVEKLETSKSENVNISFILQ